MRGVMLFLFATPADIAHSEVTILVQQTGIPLKIIEDIHNQCIIITENEKKV